MQIARLDRWWEHSKREDDSLERSDVLLLHGSRLLPESAIHFEERKSRDKSCLPLHQMLRTLDTAGRGDLGVRQRQQDSKTVALARLFGDFGGRTGSGRRVKRAGVR